MFRLNWGHKTPGYSLNFRSRPKKMLQHPFSISTCSKKVGTFYLKLFAQKVVLSFHPINNYCLCRRFKARDTKMHLMTRFTQKKNCLEQNRLDSTVELYIQFYYQKN